MIQKKVCMLGASAVGKTSLVARFVSSLFSEKYLTTVGVKVDKKLVTVDGRDVHLLLWDIHGHDDFQSVQDSYLRGMSGYLLVADGTRPATLDAAVALQARAEQLGGRIPFVLVLNKADLATDWQVNDRVVWQLAEKGWTVVRTSAKTGAGVEDTFTRLARAIIQQSEGL